MNVKWNYVDDYITIEEKLADILTDIIIERLSSEEIDILLKYLEE